MKKKEIKRLSKLIFGSTGEKISEYFEFLNINGNVLLFGKPGTGKTSIKKKCLSPAKKHSSTYQESEKIGWQRLYLVLYLIQCQERYCLIW